MQAMSVSSSMNSPLLGGEFYKPASRGTASLKATIFTIAQNTLGAGLLTMPFSFKTASIVPTALITLFVGILSAYSFLLLCRCSERMGKYSYKELAVQTLGPRASWCARASLAFAKLSCSCLRTSNLNALIHTISRMFVEFVVALLPFGTCIAYAVLIADFIPAAIQAFRPTDSYAAGRTSITLIIGCGVLFPLCLLRNLSSLKFTSVAGVVSMIFASCVVIEAIVDHKPTNLPASTIVRFDGGLFTAMSLISVAFTMHYNAQRYYQELADRTLQRIGRIIFGSFTFAFVLYVFVGIFGVLEFGDDVQSNVINNFSPSPVINATRVFLSLAIIASFPLPFHGCRSNFLRLFFRVEGDDLPTSRWTKCSRAVDNKKNGKNISLTCPQVACTVALFLPIIGISLATDNVGVVLSFKGSCLSSLVVYIIPGLAYIRLMRPAGFSGLFGPWLLIVYGTVYGVVGTYFAAYNLSKGQSHH